MVRPRFDVMDFVFLQLQLKAAVAAPTRVLPTIVREHLFRRVILGSRPTVYFNYVLGRLAPKKLQPRYITGIIVDKADQKRISAPNTKRKDVRLPKLVRGCALEKPGTGDIALPLLGWGSH